jgi:hypothetical protein
MLPSLSDDLLIFGTGFAGHPQVIVAKRMERVSFEAHCRLNYS